MISFQNAIKYIKRYLFQSVEFPDNKVASDYLHRAAAASKASRRKTAAPETGEILSDDDGTRTGSEDDLDGFIVDGNADDVTEIDGETGERVRHHKRKHRHKEEVSKSARKRHKTLSRKKDEERKRAEQEKALRQYKSSDYVHDSDDEANPEELAKFFESERLLREKLKTMQDKIVSEAAVAAKEKAALRALDEDGVSLVLEDDTARDAEEDAEMESASDDDGEEEEEESNSESEADAEAEVSEEDEVMDIDGGDKINSPDTAHTSASPSSTSRPRNKVIVDSDEED